MPWTQPPQKSKKTKNKKLNSEQVLLLSALMTSHLGFLAVLGVFTPALDSIRSPSGALMTKWKEGFFLSHLRGKLKPGEA